MFVLVITNNYHFLIRVKLYQGCIPLFLLGYKDSNNKISLVTYINFHKIQMKKDNVRNSSDQKF